VVEAKRRGEVRVVDDVAVQPGCGGGKDAWWRSGIKVSRVPRATRTLLRFRSATSARPQQIVEAEMVIGNE
jgi:hypothetical protein